jgi:ATP-dependent Clp protease ATP-binding subunit ClpA
MLRINRLSNHARLIGRKCSSSKCLPAVVPLRAFSTVENNANNTPNNPSNAAHRASFLSPKDFLDANSPALNGLPKESSTSTPEVVVGPASIKLGVQLAKYGINLTKLAQEGKLESVIGREKEFQQVVQVLSRRRKSNPVLIGEPGVGKSSIIEGLANLIAKGLVPESMKDKVIISLDLASMLAGTKFRGEFEERLKGVMKEIELAGTSLISQMSIAVNIFLHYIVTGDRIILFIDEIHSLCGAGEAYLTTRY